MLRKPTHPAQIRHQMHTGDDLPQVPGHRCLQRQQRQRLLLARAPRPLDLLIEVEHPLRQRQVGLDEGICGNSYGLTGQVAHQRQSVC
jgi:hypothetical protein